MKKQLFITIFKSLGVILFSLFLIEVLLNQDNISFRGIYTEKLFFWLGILFGFLGFGLKKFGIAMLIFLGLTMLPMMIPFINLLFWSMSSNRHYEIGKNERVEEIRPFGQYQTKLSIVKPIDWVFEEYSESTLIMCEFGNLDEIDLRSVEHQKDEKRERIVLKYGSLDKLKECVLDLK
jgi:hypothetical protein